jgi:hypothetical protein
MSISGVTGVADMPYEELLGWIHYFDRRPPEWRADLRAAYLMQVQGAKKTPQELFPSLAAVMAKPVREDGRVSAENLKASALFMKLMTAKGGDRLDL